VFSQEVVEFPIAGKVVSVNVSQGSVVAEGDVLCLLESMKMENPIIAPVAGTITEMKVSVGQAASAGDLVVVIEYLKE
jgi:biotin carboxyl carrier protein